MRSDHHPGTPAASERIVRADRARRLRRDMTRAERLLWNVLRNRTQCGFKLRRQHPIGPYIADFACAEAKLVIEVDGDSHASKGEVDRQRDTWLRKHGWRVLRVTDLAIFADREAVVGAIVREMRG